MTLGTKVVQLILVVPKCKILTHMKSKLTKFEAKVEKQQKIFLRNIRKSY